MGAQHLRVPYGLIKQLVYGGGVRLAPRVNKFRPPEPDVDAEYIPYVSYTPPISTYVAPVTGPTIIRPAHPTKVVRMAEPEEYAAKMGNLSNEAYRFFKGSHIASSDYFQCRGCEIDGYIKENKLIHMHNCRALIQAITERVRRDKICVVCDTGTSRERWTVPLCSDACITKWRFMLPNPWKVARRFVLAEQPHLLRMKCESTQINS